MAHQMQSFLAEAPVDYAFLEPCRTVRKREQHRRFGLPGKRTSLTDWSGDRYYLHASSSRVKELSEQLTAVADIDGPGHGSLVVQQVLDPSQEEKKLISSSSGTLVQITAILSLPGAGELLSQTALDYGIGVPVISLGEGTGVRDQMGLLRITIPPEKQIMNLMVPRHDLDSIFSILIEQGAMNRPGGGFLYGTPVLSGSFDTKMVVGRQKTPASLEQLITAIDELKGGTTWRKRSIEHASFSGLIRKGQYELVIFCPEGESEGVIECILSAGGNGATVSNVQSINTASHNQDTSAWERIVAIVSEQVAGQIIGTLFSFTPEKKQRQLVVEVLPVLRSYAYRDISRRR
jgi:hypothetical protein